jgi:hemerythrin-like domain-containing protein
VDAITVLKDDHKRVQKHFRDFETSSDRALVARANAAQAAIRELAVHSALEEQVFYPAIRGEVDDLTDEVLESLEEHHVVKWLCSELEGMKPEDERFAAKMTVLIENVRHHVREEEAELFPAVRQSLGRRRLNELGELLVRARPATTTHPHPRSPDTPPANVVVGLVAGAIDRVRDVGAKLVDQLTP